MFYTTSASQNGKMRPFRYTGDMPVPEMSYKPGTLATINEDAISSGLVLSYLFNEGTGTTLSDRASSPLNATLSDNAWVEDETYTSVVDFSGTLSQTAHATKINIETYSYSFAFKRGGAPGGYEYLLAKFTSSGAYPYLVYMEPDGRVGAIIYDGSTQINAISSAAYADGQWQKVIVTRTDGGNFELYVNGTLAARQTDTLGTTTNSSDFFIGNNGSFDGNFGGQIAYFHMWNRVLSGAPGSIGDTATGDIAALMFDEFLMYR